jgi:hypothetical protein
MVLMLYQSSVENPGVFLLGMFVTGAGMLVRYLSGSVSSPCRLIVPEFFLFFVTTMVANWLNSLSLPHEDWRFDAFVLLLVVSNS